MKSQAKLFLARMEKKNDNISPAALNVFQVADKIAYDCHL